MNRILEIHLHLRTDMDDMRASELYCFCEANWKVVAETSAMDDNYADLGGEA